MCFCLFLFHFISLGSQKSRRPLFGLNTLISIRYRDIWHFLHYVCICSNKCDFYIKENIFHKTVFLKCFCVHFNKFHLCKRITYFTRIWLFSHVPFFQARDGASYPMPSIHLFYTFQPGDRYKILTFLLGAIVWISFPPLSQGIFVSFYKLGCRYNYCNNRDLRFKFLLISYIRSWYFIKFHLPVLVPYYCQFLDCFVPNFIEANHIAES